MEDPILFGANKMFGNVAEIMNRSIKLEVLVTPEEAIEVAKLMQKLRSQEKQ